MLGLADINIFIAFVLCFISTGFCIIYGIVNWNKGIEISNVNEKTEDYLIRQPELIN